MLVCIWGIAKHRIIDKEFHKIISMLGEEKKSFHAGMPQCSVCSCTRICSALLCAHLLLCVHHCSVFIVSLCSSFLCVHRLFCIYRLLCVYSRLCAQFLAGSCESNISKRPLLSVSVRIAHRSLCSVKVPCRLLRN